jgi:putative PIN family toxin of toxin-antitoxin system
MVDAQQFQAAPMIPNRVVIDTNVLLDLFVFRDVRWEKLLSALEAGTVQAMTRADCAREWEIVLGYGHLPLDEPGRETAHREFRRLLQIWEGLPVPAPLPMCKDRDDQKFLELARDAQASVLITKDKALLKLARWTRKRGMFAILRPDQLASSAFPL